MTTTATLSGNTTGGVGSMFFYKISNVDSCSYFNPFQGIFIYIYYYVIKIKNNNNKN